MAKRKSSGLLKLFLFLVPLVLVAIGAFMLFRDMESPAIALSPEMDTVSPNIEFTATAVDYKSGIKSITVIVRKDARVTPVAKEVYDDKKEQRELKFKINVPELLDSSFELEIQATDSSLAGFGLGNRSTKTYKMRMDLTPPRLSVKNQPPYVRQGGTGCIMYTANKPMKSTGVRVGEYFFPAFQQPNGLYICFFAFPYNLTPKEFQPELVGIDKVENVAKLALPVNRLPRKFKSDTIKLDDNFIGGKSEEFSHMAPQATTDIDRFLAVNGDVRAANVARLLEIGRESASEMLWEGSFVTLPNASTRAGFADNRTYNYRGKDVDNQTHLGLDLASLAKASVPAANNGRVIFADYLGIYGNLIIIDHGMNLQSLYSHLSEIHVVKGQIVKRGEIIGKTGATGMAGGDHLHFGALLAGLEVSPMEWLDAHWIKDNVTDPITQAGGKAPQLISLPEAVPLPPAPTGPAPARPTPSPAPRGGAAAPRR